MADSGITQVGKYHVLELVGEGAMGVVYRAVDPVLNRAVAVKVMNDALAREEELRARFLREAQAAGSLQHPNVITIYDFGEVEGHLYIAMEYVEGDDLEHVLNVREPLPLQTKLDIITDVLSGLAYAHKRGIVHRDIKPANIRLTEDRRAKIMDFGIAHLASSRATRTGMIVGTPDYMAPEQVTGGQITAATDLFSVGTVLYEILSGARPFQSTTVHGVLYKVVSEHPPALKSMNPGLPPELYAIVQRALAKDPASRFSSALEMAAAVSAVRSSLTDPPARQSSRSLHATLSGVSSSGPHGRQAPLPATRVVSAQPRRLAAGIAVGVVLVAGAAWALLARRADLGATAALSTTTASVPDAGAPAPQGAAPPGAPQQLPTAGASQSASQSVPPSAQPSAAAAPARQSVAAPAPSSPAIFRSQQPAPRTVAGATPPAAPPESDATALRRQQASDSPAAATRASDSAPAATPVVSAPLPAPVVTAPAPSSTAAAPAAAPNPSVEIAGLVAAYARAIESRDVAQLRRAYAGITSAQQNGFESFFESVRSLHVTFNVEALDINGATADARLTGAYDYVKTDGRSMHRPVDFRASFRRDASGTWQMTSVR